MTLNEMVKRNNQSDQIEIGLIADKLTYGETGNLLRSIVEGIKEETLQKSKENPQISAERVVGVLQGLSDLQERLDMCVDIKNQLLESRKEETKV